MSLFTHMELALLRVEEAARELDALFDVRDEGPQSVSGNLDEWKLDGRRMTGAASMALLSLHDYLNDVAQAREGLEGK